MMNTHKSRQPASFQTGSLQVKSILLVGFLVLPFVHHNDSTKALAQSQSIQEQLQFFQEGTGSPAQTPTLNLVAPTTAATPAATGKNNQDPNLKVPSFTVTPLSTAQLNSPVVVNYQFPREFNKMTFNTNGVYNVIDPSRSSNPSADITSRQAKVDINKGILLVGAKCGNENGLPVILAASLCRNGSNICNGLIADNVFSPSTTFSLKYETGFGNNNTYNNSAMIDEATSTSSGSTIVGQNDQTLVVELGFARQAKTLETNSSINPIGVVNVAPLVLYSATEGCYTGDLPSRDPTPKMTPTPTPRTPDREIEIKIFENEKSEEDKNE